MFENITELLNNEKSQKWLIILFGFKFFCVKPLLNGIAFSKQELFLTIFLTMSLRSATFFKLPLACLPFQRSRDYFLSSLLFSLTRIRTDERKDFNFSQSAWYSKRFVRSVVFCHSWGIFETILPLSFSPRLFQRTCIIYYYYLTCVNDTELPPLNHEISLSLS